MLGDDFVKFLADARMDDHPLVKRAFHKLAAMTREDRPPVPAPGGPAIGREEAERKIAEMRKNPALNNSADPDHQRILAEWKRLHDLAYGA